MTRKKILFTANKMNIGGIEKSLLSLLNVLDPEKYDIHLALMQPGGGFFDRIPSYVTVSFIPSLERLTQFIGAKVRYTLRNIAAGNISHALTTLYRYTVCKLSGSLNPLISSFIESEPGLEILNTEYDLAIAYPGPSEFLDCLLAFHIKARKKAMWIHFDIDRVYHNRKSALQTNGCYDKVFCVSEDARRIYCRHYPPFTERADIFYNIVDSNEILRSADEPSSFRPARHPAINIVSVGRLHPQKGFDIALDAAAILRSKDIRFMWHIVGGGDMADELRARCGELHLDDYVKFYGATTNPYPFMKGADIYVQPSRYEGFCITLAEAKTFGMPIVATDFVGALEQLSQSPNAVICKPEAKSIALAIENAGTMPTIPADTFTSSDDLAKLDALLK